MRPLKNSILFRRNDSTLISALALLLPYAGIFGAVALGERFDWSGRILVLPVIAGLQNHLQILQHEAAHRQLFPRRFWNDFLGNLLCALPFLSTLEQYRKFHFDHHRHLLNKKLDPEIAFYAEQNYHFEALPMRKKLYLGALDLSGYHFCQFFISYNFYLWRAHDEDRSLRVRRSTWVGAALLAALACTIVYNLGLFPILWYWFLPQATWLFFFLKRQGYQEHSGDRQSVETATPKNRASWWERVFICPYNADHHREHHLYPLVPWYRLPEVRAEMDAVDAK